MNFNVGETLVWTHVDEETGKRLNEFVRVMRVPNTASGVRSARTQYQVMVLRTNDPALAFSDELTRYEE